jgi:beta-glucosidase
LSYAAEKTAAILVNWLPGQEGGYATADVLFGDYNPAGRLPVTFPQHVGQMPNYYNFKTSGRRYEYSDLEFYPLYRFGYGLSYTQFEYSGLSAQVNANGNISVKAKVTNTGKIAGDEVAQLYVTDMYASVKTRVMELKDFARVSLNPGETKEVSFTLTPYDISVLNDKMDRVVEPGDFKILVGGKSPSYKANDRIKDSVGFETVADGVSTTVNYTKALAADFEIAYLGMEENLVKNIRTATVKIVNKGNITDIGKVHLFINGVQTDEVHHYELDPGQEKVLSFELAPDASGEFSFATKYKLLTVKN